MAAIPVITKIFFFCCREPSDENDTCRSVPPLVLDEYATCGRVESGLFGSRLTGAAFSSALLDSLDLGFGARGSRSKPDAEMVDDARRDVNGEGGASFKLYDEEKAPDHTDIDEAAAPLDRERIDSTRERSCGVVGMSSSTVVAVVVVVV